MLTFPFLQHKWFVILTALDYINRTENWVKNIQATAYNGTRTLIEIVWSNLTLE